MRNVSDKHMPSGRPEFSRVIDVSDLHEPVLREIEADARECQALAVRLDVTSVDRLSARLAVRRVAGGPLVRVSGSFEAEVEQPCVVTLKPVHSAIAEEIEIEFGPVDPNRPPGPDTEEEAEQPEPLEGGEIDLGEIVAQFLSVSIDPFPRAPGAVLDKSSFGPESAQDSSKSGADSDNPFAVLKTLKSPEIKGG